MIVLSNCNAVYRAISLYPETSYTIAIVLSSHLIVAYSATDFVLCIRLLYCDFRHNRVGTLFLLRLNLSLTIDIAFLGTYRTAVLICPLLIVGLFTFGSNTTDDCFTSLPDTINFHLSIYHSLLILILGLWLLGLLTCYCFLSLTLHI